MKPTALNFIFCCFTIMYGCLYGAACAAMLKGEQHLDARLICAGIGFLIAAIGVCNLRWSDKE